MLNTYQMQVVKRNGKKEPVSFDKVIKRLKTLCSGLETIDPILVAQKVIAEIYNDVHTYQLDELAAEICTSLSTENPDFGILASRIIISNNHKNTSPSFSETMTILYNNKDIHGKHTPLLAENVYQIIMENKAKLNSVIDYTRDYNYDYFAFKTLERAYLMRVDGNVVERIQHMVMRVSVGLHFNDINKAVESYKFMSQKYFTHATPTLFHAGTSRPSLASCFDENTEIFTLDGIKKIIDVKIGDEVVTHNGNIKKVIQLHKNILGNRKMYELNVYKSKSIKVTENHRFLAIKDRKSRPNWYRIDELNNKSYIVIPNRKKYSEKNEIIDLALYFDILFKDKNKYNMEVFDNEVQLSTYFNNGIEKKLKGRRIHNKCNRYIPLDEDFYYLAGLFIGDGHIITRKNKNNEIEECGIGFTMNKENVELIEIIKIFGNKLFGIHAIEHNMKTQNVHQILYHSTFLGKLFLYLFGNGFNNKHLNKFLYNCGKKYLYNFVAGLITTDGCISKEHNITISLSNQNLVNELYHLLRANNIDCSFKKNSYMSKLSTVIPHSLRIPAIKEILEKVIKTYNDNRIQILIEKIENNKGFDSRTLYMHDTKFLKISSINQINYNKQYVYTLGIEDDHSYNVEGLICENCFLIGTSDSIDSASDNKGIYKTISDCAVISKWAGGIGVHISNIRSKGTKIRGTNGKSDGIIPMLKVYNDTAKYVNQCFTPETVIYTKEGIKEARNVKENDELLTKDGTFRKVMEVFKNERNEEIVKYRIMSSLFPNRCTKQHQIYVLKNVAKINNHNILKERLTTGELKGEYVNAGELTDKDYVVFPIPKNVEDIEEDDKMYFYLYGMCLMKSKVTDGIISLEVGEHIIGDIKKFFAERNVPYEIEKRKIFKWKMEDDIFHHTLKAADNKKRLFPAYWNLPEEKLKALMQGIFFKRNIEIRIKDYEKSFVSTIRYLSLRLGFLLRGELKNGLYHIRYPKELDGKKNNRYFRHGDKLYTKIMKVKMVNFKGNVYDFNIDENHNYTTDSGLVHNSGKRPGSFAFYLEPHHPDVMAFLDLKKNHGSEDERARDLFLAMWISDLFMERVRDDKDWSLLDPDECRGLQDVYGEDYKYLYEKYESEGKAKKVLKARTVWRKILESQIETGVPYISYKDAVNRKNNQKNYGVIKSSNLCVAPETKILTDEGYQVISDFVDQNVNVWNGQEFSRATVRKTGENQKLIEIHTNNGLSLSCTEYHKFYICDVENNIKKVNAYELKIGDNLINTEVVLKRDCKEFLPNDAKIIDEYYDKFNRMKWSYNNIRVSKIIDNNRYDDTYCFNEHKRHMGLFNGILTGNCNEINLYSDEKEYSVCVLSSIALSRFVENNNKFNYQKLEEVVKVAITNLDRIVDINFYPTPETKYSNMKHRPIGLGVQGLQDVFFKMRAPFESERARELNRNIFETIYYAAVKTSCELAKVEGPYETFWESPIAKGQFQFDLWGIKPSDRYDWEALRKDVMQYGIRNSTLTALMPTASTAQILGSVECFEPITSNIYSRRTIAGDFAMVNKYLVDDLIRIGLWSKEMKDTIIAANGSIQNIEGIPQELKDLYKTVWEIKQKCIIEMAAERGPYICQAQSMNLFFEEPTPNVLHSALMHGWRLGLKTGSYYIRSRPKVQAQQFTIDPEKVKKMQNRMGYKTLMNVLENPDISDCCSG